jgi:hypothetical protein
VNPVSVESAAVARQAVTAHLREHPRVAQLYRSDPRFQIVVTAARMTLAAVVEACRDSPDDEVWWLLQATLDLLFTDRLLAEHEEMPAAFDRATTRPVDPSPIVYRRTT